MVLTPKLKVSGEISLKNPKVDLPFLTFEGPTYSWLQSLCLNWETSSTFEVPSTLFDWKFIWNCLSSNFTKLVMEINFNQIKKSWKYFLRADKNSIRLPTYMFRKEKSDIERWKPVLVHFIYILALNYMYYWCQFLSWAEYVPNTYKSHFAFL